MTIDVKQIFQDALNESNGNTQLDESSAELSRLKSLVQEIEKAEKSGNKAALNHIWAALYNFKDSIAFGSHIEKYKDAIK